MVNSTSKTLSYTYICLKIVHLYSIDNNKELLSVP